MHKLKHEDIHMCRMAYLTQFSTPALLNPMIEKMVDEASAILLLICSYEVWVKVTYDWSTALCLCLCSCRPSFHKSKLQHKHKHKYKKNKLVGFSCAYAFAYIDPVFTCLHICLCVIENQALVHTHFWNVICHEKIVNCQGSCGPSCLKVNWH